MNRERFLSIVDAYGADVRRWPGEERAAALAFVEADPEMAVALGEADRLDALLDGSRPLAPSPSLRGRVAAAAPRARPSSPMRFRWWAPGAGLAAAGVAGLVLGSSLLAPQEPVTDAALLAELESYETLVDPAEGQF